MSEKIVGMIWVAGEALIDLVATNRGSTGKLAPAQRVLVPHPGGGPYNAARALARLGMPVAFVGRLSSDHFGRLLREGLIDDGVDTSLTVRTDDPTTLAVAVVEDDGKASYTFYLDGTSAPGLLPADVDILPGDCSALHVGTLGLAMEPVGSTLESLASDLFGRVPIVLDPNVRPGVIRDAATYRARVARLASMATVVKVSDEDALWLEPNQTPLETARQMVRSGAGMVALTNGAKGALGVSADHEVEVPAEPVAVVDTIGAGDSFGAGLVCWLVEHGCLGSAATLDRDEIAASLLFAGRVAAITVSRSGAVPPHRHEVS